MADHQHLDLYSDAPLTLARLQDKKLAILSNGSSKMLNDLVCNTGLADVLDATISIDTTRIFKPSPTAYELVETTLGVAPADVLFVSSNPWDAIGAKSAGLNTVWIERVSPEAMAKETRNSEMISPLTMFRAMRMQMDELGLVPDHRIHGLSALVDLVSAVPA